MVVVPPLEQILGGSAGLPSASVIVLTKQWQDDHTVFQQCDLKGREFVYVWADGVHPKSGSDRSTRACWSCSECGWTAPRS